jgi:hypothetical protein
LPNGFIVDVPTGVSYSSRAVTTVGGDTVYNLSLSWDYHSNAFVTGGGQFEIQYKLSSASSWSPSLYADGDLVAVDTVINSVNTSYDLRIRAINAMNAKSNWVTLTNCIIGSSGGVSVTNDWGSVASAAVTFIDYGYVYDTVTTTEDWGAVI